MFENKFYWYIGLRVIRVSMTFLAQPHCPRKQDFSQLEFGIIATFSTAPQLLCKVPVRWSIYTTSINRVVSGFTIQLIFALLFDWLLISFCTTLLGIPAHSLTFAFEVKIYEVKFSGLTVITQALLLTVTW